jgi:surface antigen
MMFMLISGCSSTYNAKMSTANDYTTGNSAVGVGFNILKYHAYTIPKIDRERHETCVYFALDNMQLGETCDWYSSNGSTKGKVAVVAHRPQGGGYCTVLFNSVYHKGNWKNWRDTACKKGVGNQWKWSNR